MTLLMTISHTSQSEKKTRNARHVVIVGGGVIGATSAYFLAKAGCKVTILERGRFAGGCSHANCGLISPSHVLPLTQPSALSRAFKAMLNPSGPFSIRPQADLSMLSWLLQFALRCNHEDMIKGGRARHALLKSSAALYDKLISKESLACEYKKHGCLFVYPEQKALDRFDASNDLLANDFGVPARKLDGAALIEMEPALKPGLAGAWFYEVDGHLRPDRLMKAWHEKLIQLNVNIIEGAEVTGLSFEGQSNALATSVNYNQLPVSSDPKLNNATLPAETFTAKENATGIHADQLLFATGAWTPKLNQWLGTRIPIQPGKGYSMTMSRPAICPRHPMILEGHRVAVTPMDSGYRLGSTMQFAGYDSHLDESRLKLLTEGASHYLHEPYTDAVQETWFGWRPMTIDGAPVIDQSPRFANVFIAAGHNMLGLSMAPATGQLISELMTDSAPHINPELYKLSRFE